MGILVNIVVALIFVFMMGIFSAFTPGIYKQSNIATIVGTLAWSISYCN